MKFENYMKKLRESDAYKKFRRSYQDEYLCAGFFVLDYETGQNMHQIDYSLPNGKIATFLFETDKGIQCKISEQALKKKLPEIKVSAKTDLEALRGIVEDEMKNRTVTEKIRKMIAVLHIMDGRLVWNLQCILDGMGILMVHLDDTDQSVLKFEKHSIMEFIRPGMGAALLAPKDAKGKKINVKDLKALEQELKKLQEEAKKKKGIEKISKKEDKKK